MEPVATNPYSPPESPLLQERTAAVELASRGRRLGGRVFDVVLGYVAALPLLLSLDVAKLVEIARDYTQFVRLYTSSTGGRVALLATIALTTVNWYLIATRGQSLGKMLAGVRIVQTDGSPAGFLHGVVLRQWVMVVLGTAPAVALILGAPPEMVNPIALPLSGIVTGGYLLIFGSARRCGHDYIAGTRVIRSA